MLDEDFRVRPTYENLLADLNNLVKKEDIYIMQEDEVI